MSADVRKGCQAGSLRARRHGSGGAGASLASEMTETEGELECGAVGQTTISLDEMAGSQFPGIDDGLPRDQVSVGHQLGRGVDRLDASDHIPDEVEEGAGAAPGHPARKEPVALS